MTSFKDLGNTSRRLSLLTYNRILENHFTDNTEKKLRLKIWEIQAVG